MDQTSIVWFRNDLRLHDNEALSTAIAESRYILPVYCFDPLDYGRTSAGIDRTGPARAGFILECVAKLREDLRSQGSDLIVRVGKPEEVLVDLAKGVHADVLYAHQEVSNEEIQAESKVAAALKKEGVQTKFLWGGTLIHIDDLPFELEQMPTNYSKFRQMVQNVAVQKALGAPKQLKGLPPFEALKHGVIPSAEDLGLEPPSVELQDEEDADGPPFVGGEEEALQMLKDFILEYPKQTVSDIGELGCEDSSNVANFCCKLSPWLAIGCLSPRRMFEDIKESMLNSALAGPTCADSLLTSLLFELLWRDFFRFVTKMYAVTRSSNAHPLTACVKDLAA